ncbi:MAG: DUF4974 domain-containing protein [Agriterribacter sp.]
MHTRQIKSLINRYKKGKCTEEEKALIESWYNALLETGQEGWNEADRKIAGQLIEAKLISRISETETQSKIFYLNSNVYRKAAVVVLLLISGAFLIYQKQFRNSPHISKANNSSAPLTADIPAPQSNKAVIILANGKKVFIDNPDKNEAALRGEHKAFNVSGGDVLYESVPHPGKSAPEINTLVNPKGSKVLSLQLSDGTRVWLNAGTTLTYPVFFPENERNVTISGEAYFEVIHNPKAPFTVEKNNLKIKVLGTSFNVNAYEDEQHLKVTLINGSVSLTQGKNYNKLQPGQQAVVDKEIHVISNADVEEALAWKNGFFQFNNAELKEVLRQLSRWYDVDIAYENTVRQRRFVGEIERGLRLSQVLEILSKNDVHFKLEGKKIFVLY